MFINPMRVNLGVSKLLTLISLTLFTLFAANSAFAGWWHKTPEERATKMVEKVTQELALDQTQTTLLKTSVSEMMAKFKEAKPEKGAMHQILREQIRSGKIDKVQVKQVAGEHKQKIEALMDFGLDKADAFLQTLSPEQREKLLTFVDEMKDRGHGHKRCWF